MKLVSTDSLLSSRVYLTVFDRVTYSQVAWTPQDIESIRMSLARQLKFIIMIKGHVVVAASHLLESELAQEILCSHPRLFSEGIVVPALRSEFQTFEQFLDTKLSEANDAMEYSGAKKKDTAKMLDETVALAVRWEVSQASRWFQKRMIADIEDGHSLLRSCLRQNRIITPSGISEKIAAVPRLGRNDVYQIAKGTGDKGFWNICGNYTDFIYYLSGARAVDSEGVLPQENLMDFSLSDMIGGKTNLSDMEVFFKMFVDIVKSATHTHFPVDLLDAMDIEDALDLHHIAVNQDFIAKYNRIQEITKEGLALQDPERLVLLMEELEQYEMDLHSQYQRAIDAELPRYYRDSKRSAVGKLLNAIASLLIPWYGAPANARDILVSGLELGRKRDIAQSITKRIDRCAKACLSVADRGDASSRPVLLRFIKEIGRKYADKLPGGQ